MSAIFRNGVAYGVSVERQGHIIVNSTGTTMPQRNKLRFVNLSAEDDATDDTTVVSASAIKIGDVTGASATTTPGTRSIVLRWSDPENVVINGVTVAEWAGTKIVRKVGSAPMDETDGTLITNNTIKNAYSSTGYVDDELTYGTTYYYRFFPYTRQTVTNGSSVDAVPDRISVAVPTFTATMVYDGTEQTASFTGYDSSQMIVSGNIETNAGDYTAIFNVKEDYKWTDETRTEKSVAWSIGRKTEAIIVSSSSVTLDMSHKTVTVIVSNVNGRTLSVSSDDTSVATASVAENVITISHVNQTDGSATITVSAAQSTNYNASSATIDVIASFISTVLNDNTWDTIKFVAQEGTGANYWSVGDRKAVEINGTVGICEFNNYTAYAYILGFNHNSDTEGTAIHFQFGFDALTGGNHIAFCDSSYSSYNTSQCFNMNPAADSSSVSNAGGWASSKMRTVLIPEFITRLPSALQSVLKAITKYTDNVGNGSGNIAANVTTTLDKVFLLAEYELFGERKYANQYEYTDGKQAQYDYYKNGNSKTMKNHTNTGNAIFWWGRSVSDTSWQTFCIINNGGKSGQLACGQSNGFAPGFAVG